MNLIRLSLVIIATLVLTTTTASAAGKDENPVRRMSIGTPDGNKTYYTVWCTNKSIGSVTAEHDQEQYCAMARGGKRRCDKNWTIREASIKACQVQK